MAVGADVARLRAVAPDYMRTMDGYQRRNLALLILDGATFAFAISLLSETTIIPAFVQALSGSALLVGLVGAIYAVGHYLPQLIGAHLVAGRERIFLETMENVLGSTNKVIVEPGANGQGVVPYLPLPEVKARSGAAQN